MGLPLNKTNTTGFPVLDNASNSFCWLCGSPISAISAHRHTGRFSITATTISDLGSASRFVQHFWSSFINVNFNTKYVYLFCNKVSSERFAPLAENIGASAGNRFHSSNTTAFANRPQHSRFPAYFSGYLPMGQSMQ
jgi:hypothetical protein